METEQSCLVCGMTVPQLPAGTSGPPREYCQPEPGEDVSLCRLMIKSMRRTEKLLARVRRRNGGKYGALLHGESDTYFRESNRLRQQPYPYGRVAAGKPGAGQFLPRNGVELEEGG